MKSPLSLAALIIATSAIPVSAAEALWLRDVKISPDGQTIAFEYKGDIYTVPVAGGEALQTHHPQFLRRKAGMEP